MTHYLSKEQVQHAINIHDTGLSWKIVASVLKTTEKNLRESIKYYELFARPIVELLKQAELTNNQKEAIDLINKATRLQEKMGSQFRSSMY